MANLCRYIAAMMLVLAACSNEDRRGGESEAFHRYWTADPQYLRNMKSDPELAIHLEQARQRLRTLSDRQFERLKRLGIMPFEAGEIEHAARKSWSTVGIDWTRYTIPFDQSAQDSAANEKARDRRMCRDMEYLSVAGHVPTSGRAAQQVFHGGAIGVVPSGRNEYRGTLLTRSGERLPVTWDRVWNGEPKNAEDPLDADSHSFHLQRLRGAKYWFVAEVSDSSIGRGSILTSTNCMAMLATYPRPRSASPLTGLPWIG